jgi:hypothetical protein
MGSSVAGHLTPAEVADLEATRERLLTAGSGAPPGKFVFFAAFDGTNNDKNNIPLSGHPYQTNVANLYDQAWVAQDFNPNLGTGYYPGVGTGSANGNWINAGILPTRAVHNAAESALVEFAVRARDFLKETATATYADLSAATVGFSRGTASEVVFARLLHERGLVLSDGSVVAPPGSVRITGMVMLDPVHTFIEGDLSLPPNVVGQVMVLGARDELRGEFKLADYRNDPRVSFTELAGNHAGIGGGYDLHGTGAVALEASTAFLKNSGVALADVPPEHRFDPGRPIARYTELYQVARNGDVLSDAQGRPATEWSTLPSRGIAPVRSFGHALSTAQPTRLDDPAHPGHANGRGRHDAPEGLPPPRGDRLSGGPQSPLSWSVAATGPDDPRHEFNACHALYNELKERCPDASEKRLLQFTALCHTHGITDQNLSAVRFDQQGGFMHFASSGLVAHVATAVVKQASPQPEQSIQQIRQHDQRQAPRMDPIQVQYAQMNQQGTMR